MSLPGIYRDDANSLALHPLIGPLEGLTTEFHWKTLEIMQQNVHNGAIRGRPFSEWHNGDKAGLMRAYCMKAPINGVIKWGETLICKKNPQAEESMRRRNVFFIILLADYCLPSRPFCLTTLNQYRWHFNIISCMLNKLLPSEENPHWSWKSYSDSSYVMMMRRKWCSPPSFCVHCS